ncbi:MAG: glycosyltransferase family 4 protein [Bacteroidia bacterium]|nr:glycosyltransferase family 4 protein [Bacteroidia bacterium]MCZ2278151.1 glycosyltransferase family 4 protein [Bacteroidia bacterium]
MSRKLVFLAYAPSGYLFTCIERILRHYDAAITVVHYPLDPDAPFKMNLSSPKLKFLDKSHFNKEELLAQVKSVSPDVIFCSGWGDAEYKYVCKNMKGKSRRVLKFDNPWQNTFKQNLMRLIGPVYLRSHFDACWVSGNPQRQYALRIGFKDHQISEGGYSCDFEYFHSEYLRNKENKHHSFPKRFIYVGRYIPIKGVDRLWQAFYEFQQERPNEWELWCLGKGELRPQMPEHPAIKDFGFVQPSEMGKFIEQTGIFIMPSVRDHWGVAVHEYAASGFPLVCSSGVYAVSAFLKDGYNGFIHQPDDKESLKSVLNQIIDLDQSQLALMGDRSARLAAVMKPDIWAGIAWEFADAANWPVFRFNN